MKKSRAPSDKWLALSNTKMAKNFIWTALRCFLQINGPRKDEYQCCSEVMCEVTEGEVTADKLEHQPNYHHYLNPVHWCKPISLWAGEVAKRQKWRTYQLNIKRTGTRYNWRTKSAFSSFLSPRNCCKRHYSVLAEKQYPVNSRGGSIRFYTSCQMLSKTSMQLPPQHSRIILRWRMLRYELWLYAVTTGLLRNQCWWKRNWAEMQALI